MKKAKVVYTVTFECTIEVPDDRPISDVLSEIDIPEGGWNGSEYCEKSIVIGEIVYKDEPKPIDGIIAGEFGVHPNFLQGQGQGKKGDPQ
jgi:hypothetical protein